MKCNYVVQADGSSWYRVKRGDRVIVDFIQNLAVAKNLAFMMNIGVIGKDGIQG